MSACEQCGQEHVATRGGRPCLRHTNVKDDDGRIVGKRACRKPAIPGSDWCSTHGGSSPQAKAKAKQRIERAEAEKTLAEALTAAYGDDIPDVPPADAMLRAVSWTFAEVVVLRRKVAELGVDERVWGVTREKTGGEDYGTTEEARPNVWWSMLRESMRDLVKFSAAARAAGCDEARVRLAQEHGRMLADVIRGILTDLHLSADQEAMVSDVVPRHLRAVAS